MSRRTGRATLVAGISATLALLTAGCVQLPERGAVHETDTSADTSVEQASSIDAVPPRPNAQPADIAKGFIDAMSAWPIQTGVAKQFLSEEAAAAWKPDQGTITFADALVTQDRSTEVTVELSGAERLDGRGAWQGELPVGERELDFTMTVENGENRITNPPNALVVPSRWFAERFRQVSLYFFDRTGGILVPEPVFVPRGEQLASTLTLRLVDGPGADLTGISRSYLPTDLDPGLSVPVTADGVAQVEFGESVATSRAEDDLERMLAQLRWTLRQVPGIRALRVSIGGEEVRLGGDAEYDVNRAQQYDPAGDDANPLLYGLRDGRLVYGEADSLAPAEGPLGADAHGLRSVALRLDASIAAGVSTDGDEVHLAQVRGAQSDRVRTIARGSSDLLPPAWDFTNRLWLVDRAAEAARVRYREGPARLQTLDVPGVSGRRVRAFLVSRDATRFVAVVRGREGDQVRAGRILVDDQGRIDRAGPTRRIPLEIDRVRIRDIAWTSPTSIAVLRPVSAELFEVSTVAVDGAPTVAEPLSTSISGRVVGLAAAPDSSRTPYAVTREELVDLESLATVSFTEGRVRSIGYVG